MVNNIKTLKQLLIEKSVLTSLAILLSVAGMGQQVKHVVLITIDGFRPDFYLDSTWPAPHLREIMKQGRHAKGVTSVFPSITYPSHTTIATGVQPDKHGVYYNAKFDPTGVNKKDFYWHDSSIQVPTLWKMAHDKGLKVAMLFWPVSAGAPVDYNIPDIGGMGEEVRERYAVPAGFIQQMRQEVFNGVPKIEYGKDQNTARIASYIINKDAPALLAVHLFSVDHAEHEQGRKGPLVNQAISDADEAVAMIIDALKQKGIWKNTVLIVTGDHGFITTTKKLDANLWLKNAGLMNNLKTNDWKAQFNYAGGSANLYLKESGDTVTLAQVQQILQALPDSCKQMIRVINRKQLDAIGANPHIALALNGEHGVLFANLKGKLTAEGSGGNHGYFPDNPEIRTGFLVCGVGIKAGSSVEEMNLRDIAPFIEKLLKIGE